MQTTRYVSNWSHDMCQLCHRQQILRAHWAIQMPIIAIYLNWILFLHFILLSRKIQFQTSGKLSMIGFHSTDKIPPDWKGQTIIIAKLTKKRRDHHSKETSPAP
jgi:hypothetical protein